MARIVEMSAMPSKDAVATRKLASLNRELIFLANEIYANLA